MYIFTSFIFARMKITDLYNFIGVHNDGDKKWENHVDLNTNIFLI
jgi:hypothetical protein